MVNLPIEGELDEHTTGLTGTEHAARVGVIVANWTYLEDRMVMVLGALLGGDLDTARSVFFSVGSSQARIAMMRHLVREKAKGGEYAELIDEFEGLSRARNAYVHGKWIVLGSGDVYLCLSTADMLDWDDGEKVSLEDLDDTIERMNSLARRIGKVATRDKRFRTGGALEGS